MESLLRVKELAERLGVSQSKAYGLVAEGTIEHVAIDGAVRVEPHVVEQYISQQRTVGTPPERRRPRKKAENSR